MSIEEVLCSYKRETITNCEILQDCAISLVTGTISSVVFGVLASFTSDEQGAWAVGSFGGFIAGGFIGGCISSVKNDHSPVYSTMNIEI